MHTPPRNPDEMDHGDPDIPSVTPRLSNALRFPFAAFFVGAVIGWLWLRLSTDEESEQDSSKDMFAEKPKEPEKDPVTTERITHLIGMLASRNAAPAIDRKHPDEHIAVLDKAYDRNLQVPVYLAMQELLGEGEAAFDLLLKHVDDPRYSLSVTNCEFDKNRTVGDICEMIFWSNIHAFKDDLHLITRDQSVYPPRLGGSTKEWWEGKKKLGLAGVQLEAIDATIEFMEKADATKVSTIHPEAERFPPAKFDRLRKENIRILKAIRETILSTGKPHSPKTRGDHLIGLPWSRDWHK